MCFRQPCLDELGLYLILLTDWVAFQSATSMRQSATSMRQSATSMRQSATSMRQSATSMRQSATFAHFGLFLQSFTCIMKAA